MGSKLCFGVALVYLFLVAFDNGVLTKELKAGQETLQQDQEILEKSFILDRTLTNEIAKECNEANNSVRCFAAKSSPKKSGIYYGTQATISVYGLPEVKKNQYSAALIFIINFSDDIPEEYNIIEAGWMVNPGRYNDNRPHLFTLWTADGFQKRCCYDTHCPEFVLANKSTMVPGSPINQVSIYGGPQYNITIKIYKERTSGNWWLYYGASGHYTEVTAVGYWPSSIFTSLANHATHIQWAGVVYYTEGEEGPPMGSGHYADEGEGKAAHFSGMKLVDQDGNTYDYDDFWNVDLIKRCYSVSRVKDNRFFFGGPGRCT